MKMTIVAAAVLAAGSLFAETKIAVVDMMVLVKNHASYETNKKLLESTEKDYQTRLDNMRTEIDKIEDEGRKLAEEFRNPMLAAAAKSKIEADIGNVQKRYIAAQQRMREEAMRNRQELADLEARLLKAQADDIRKRVEEYAKKNGYDLVIDKSATIHSAKTLDVTDEVLKAMDAKPANTPGKEKNEGK